MRTLGVCLLCLVLGFDLGWNTSRTEQRWWQTVQAWQELGKPRERARPAAEPRPREEPKEAVAGWTIDLVEWLGKVAE